jgi:hypothetical protein
VLVVKDSTLPASIWDPVRIGVRYLKRLREKIGNAITAARPTDGPFASEYDLERRVPSIQKTELTLLAKLEHSTGQERSMIAARLSGARNALGKRMHIKM